jgi:hypothetical protein
MWDSESFSTTSFSTDSWWFGDVVVSTTDPGAPWWEAENAKKKKKLEDVLKNDKEQWDNAAYILLLLKG